MLVYPACAGIDQDFYRQPAGKKRLPRMRGDRPIRTGLQDCQSLFTPHARGSTSLGMRIYGRNDVYPACAGIDLTHPHLSQRSISLPRMRGDRPGRVRCYDPQKGFTPHARGSTGLGSSRTRVLQVYPACAGIDPNSHFILFSSFCLPRMRGDRPDIQDGSPIPYAFTPHARGSTTVEEEE